MISLLLSSAVAFVLVILVTPLAIRFLRHKRIKINLSDLHRAT